MVPLRPTLPILTAPFARYPSSALQNGPAGNGHGPSLRPRFSLGSRGLHVFLGAFCALGLGSVSGQSTNPAEPTALDFGTGSMLGPVEVQRGVEPGDQLDYDAAELVTPAETNGPERQPASRWQVHPHFDAKATYDDNIFIQPRNEVRDVIFTLAPGIALGYWDSAETFDSYIYREKRASRLERPSGNYLFADYTASVVRFASHTAENTFDHDLALEGQWSGEKLTLGLLYRFVSGAQADTDLGGRVKRKVTTTTARAAYRFTEKTSLESNFTYTTVDPRGFVSSDQLRNENWLTYLATPLTSVSLGATFGRLNVEAAGHETFQQALLRLTYLSSEKLTLRATGGVEFRKTFEGGQRNTPIFGLNATYTPREGTVIALDAFRQIENSAFEAGRDYVHTGVSAGLRQLVGGKFYLTLEGGYRVSDYNEPILSQTRKDEYLYGRAGLLYNLARWGNLQLLYLHGRNSSTLEEFSFVNNQLEFQVSLLF